MTIQSVRYRFANRQGKRSWTETWTWEMGAASRTGIEAEIRRAAAIRANCLVVTNNLIDATYWPYLFPKQTVLIPIDLPGRVGDTQSLMTFPQDVVNISRLVQLSSAAGRRRQYLWRGIADDDFTDGSFAGRTAFATRYDAWLSFITNAPPFLMRTSVFVPILPRIVTINSNTITFESSIQSTLIGVPLRIKTNVAGNGPVVTATVLTTTLNAGATIGVNWPHGDCVGGRARTFTYEWSPIVSVTPRREGRTRKTAGPLTRFRGKR